MSFFKNFKKTIWVCYIKVSGDVILNLAYAFSIYSNDDKEEKGEDQKRNKKPTQMYLEEVKEVYKWWRPLHNSIL